MYVFCHSDFTYTYVIKFGESRNSKIAHFCNYRGSEFCWIGKFQPSKSAKIQKTQYSNLLNALKWLILHFYNAQNWFHVKSVWLKFPLCVKECLQNANIFHLVSLTDHNKLQKYRRHFREKFSRNYTILCCAKKFGTFLRYTHRYLQNER